jgi:type IV pilus assembly protein PilQ
LDFLGDLDARLGLYELEDKVKVISSPKIVTLNGEQAGIEQSTEIPIQKSTIVNGTTTNSTEFKPLTLQLKVKPQISADGGVVLDVQVKREFLGGQSDAGVSVNKREASTKILVLNGQTIVMGGIYQSDIAEGEEGIPYLRKIPVLGALFRTNTVRSDKNELLIFLTPRVLNLDKAFKAPKGL